MTNSESGNDVVDGQLVRVSHGDGQPVDLLAIIEKRNQLLDRVLQYAIQATHTEQWFDLGGKPWPSGPACEAMARRCGVSITNVQKLKRVSSDDRGDFYIWEVTGTASLPSGYDSIEVFGTCSSRDTFLGTDTKAGRKVSEIDEGNIMKAAYTNMTVNAITRLLGVRSLSWERLGGAGLDRAKMGRVEYESGAKGGAAKSAGGSLELKFGRGKGKTIGEQGDEDLAWYATAFEKDLADPEKEKYRKNTEKQLAAVKEEQVRRANAKAGTEANRPGSVSVWQRLQQLASAQGVSLEKLKELTKQVTKKTAPTELVEADLTAVADAVALLGKQSDEGAF